METLTRKNNKYFIKYRSCSSLFSVKYCSTLVLSSWDGYEQQLIFVTLCIDYISLVYGFASGFKIYIMQVLTFYVNK